MHTGPVHRTIGVIPATVRGNLLQSPARKTPASLVLHCQGGQSTG